MSPTVMQRRLSPEQVEAFHHDHFVRDQLQDFAKIMRLPQGEAVADVGGGIGVFARGLAAAQGHRTRVIDMDPDSVEAAKRNGVEAELGDALSPPIRGNEAAACFNLILHHLVAANEAATRALQIRALRAWHGKARAVFVNEYCYESFLPGFSGRLIFEVTSSSILSSVAKTVSYVVPSLRANTFGVGVRFRSHLEWTELFKEAGFRVTDAIQGTPEPIDKPRRLLLIKTIRRDSFRLEAA